MFYVIYVSFVLSNHGGDLPRRKDYYLYLGFQSGLISIEDIFIMAEDANCSSRPRQNIIILEYGSG